MSRKLYRSWASILDHAAEIARSYDTRVTLRQLYYRLVADGTLRNVRADYVELSRNSAEARREGWFPDLLDRTSGIEERLSFTDPDDARDWLRELYRKDRTEGQEWTIVLGVEKAGMSAQFDRWMTNPLGIPHVALGGYASQTLCDQVRERIEQEDRPAVLVYAGDFDPTGEDIDRDFAARVGIFDKVVRVALHADQVLDLPQNVIDPEVGAKLERDSRARSFRERHREFLDEHYGGELVQFEVDALDPEALHNLLGSAVEPYWNDDAHQAVLDQEAEDRDEL